MVVDYVPLPGGHKMRLAMPTRQGVLNALLAVFEYMTTPTFYKFYFIFNWTCIFGGASILLLLSPSISYVDGMYMCASAFGQVGLTTLDLSKQPYTVNIVLTLIILLGSNITQTVLPLMVRRRLFNPKLASRIDLLEYKAIGKLLPVVGTFYVGTQAVAFTILAFFVASDMQSLAVLTENNASPLGWAAMMTVTGFHSNGLLPISDNLMRFYNKPLPLMVLSTITIMGETMYPVILRFLIWILCSCSTGHDRMAYRYLLKNSRRVYTHLFPRSETYWLLMVAIFINAIEFFFFVVVNWSSSAFSHMDTGQRILAAYFMATTTRKSGFNVIDITQLDFGMISFYIGAMYLSTSPVAAAVRSSSGRFKSSIYTQAKSLLTQDTLWLFLIFVAICTKESDRLKDDPNFRAFAVVFELVSAYGTVGLSLNFYGTPVSFSGVWTDFSKVMLVCAMVIGRLRGFPDDDEVAIRVHQEATHSGIGGIITTNAIRPVNSPLPPGGHTHGLHAPHHQNTFQKAQSELQTMMENLTKLAHRHESSLSVRPAAAHPLPFERDSALPHAGHDGASASAIVAAIPTAPGGNAAGSSPAPLPTPTPPIMPPLLSPAPPSTLPSVRAPVPEMASARQHRLPTAQSLEVHLLPIPPPKPVTSPASAAPDDSVVASASMSTAAEPSPRTSEELARYVAPRDWEQFDIPSRTRTTSPPHAIVDVGMSGLERDDEELIRLAQTSLQGIQRMQQQQQQQQWTEHELEEIHTSPVRVPSRRNPNPLQRVSVSSQFR